MKQGIFSRLYVFFAVSACVLIPGIWSILTHGLKPSIDFTGGSMLELKTSAPNVDQLVLSLQKIEGVQSVVKTDQNSVIIRAQVMSNDEKNQIVAQLSDEVTDIEELRFETLGPLLGKELLNKTLVAVGLVSLIITLYVWRQFNDFKFGVSAILAMLHDSLVVLGMFSLFGWWWGVEVDVLFVTALLTTLSFSVHDTIVVFDRIRELKQKHRGANLETIAHYAVLETMSRSINNSMTIIIMLVALVLLGGDTIRWFGVALLVGSITGTYSSTFTAVPLVLTLTKFFAQKKSRVF